MSVPDVRGNTFDLEIQSNGTHYVKVGDQVITEDKEEVRLFLQAYKMGRNHKKTEIRNALAL